MTKQADLKQVAFRLEEEDLRDLRIEAARAGVSVNTLLVALVLNYLNDKR